MNRALTAAMLIALAIATPAARTQSFFGGVRPYDKVSWGICTTGPCVVVSDLTVPYITLANLRFARCYAAAKTAPEGSALIFDILRNGTSIFGASKLQIAAGANTGQIATFANANLNEGDLVRVDILQIGSGTPGQNVSIACRLELR